MPTPRNADTHTPSTEAPSTPFVPTEGPSTAPIESMIRQIGIDKVYGSPIVQGDVALIPVAELRTGFGYGRRPDADGTPPGTGGGAGIRMIPRGYIEVTPEGVQYRPIRSLTPLLAGGAFLAWLTYRLLAR